METNGFGVPGASYRFETSANMQTWTPGPVTTADPATGVFQFQTTEPQTTPRLFLRVVQQ